MPESPVRTEARRRAWQREIDQELSYIKAITWYIKAMLVTYCTLATFSCANTSKPAMIEELNRWSVCSSIAHEALNIYNSLYRISKSRVAVIDANRSHLHGKIGSIHRFDTCTKCFEVFLDDDDRSNVSVLMSPERLEPLNVLKHPQKKVSSCTTRKISVQWGGTTHEVTFYKSCFTQFWPFFDPQREIQTEHTYNMWHTYLSDTVDREKERSCNEADDLHAFKERIQSSGNSQYSMSGDPCNALFRFPFATSNHEVIACSDELNYFDRVDSTEDKPPCILTALNEKKLSMDESGLSSILPNQPLNDDVVNFLSTW